MSCCAICGSKRTVDEKSPAICQYLCYWTLQGWIGWNARLGEVAIRDARAMDLFPDRLSYPKMVATARIMGWTGRENFVGTFTATLVTIPSPPKAPVEKRAAA
jgi:hypothetical protein